MENERVKKVEKEDETVPPMNKTPAHMYHTIVFDSTSTTTP